MRNEEKGITADVRLSRHDLDESVLWKAPPHAPRAQAFLKRPRRRPRRNPLDLDTLFEQAGYLFPGRAGLMRFTIEGPWLKVTAASSEAGQTIAEFLAPWSCSRAYRYKLEVERKITLNGQPTRQSARLKNGDELALKVFGQEEPDFVPWDVPVRILYEDELILAVSKSAV